jgi:hypothetical protein
LFTTKGNFVFMRNLYHKVAVASVVCTAIGLVLGASEEVKATRITLTPTVQFGITTTYNRFGDSYNELSPRYDIVSNSMYRGGSTNARLAEFNISSFFIAPNTIIKSAVFQDKISSFTPRSVLSIFGYRGNGKAEAYDRTGVFLSSVDISSLSPGDTLNFDVTTFVNQEVSYHNAFAGFVMEISFPHSATLEGTDALGRSSLIIETVDVAEPVPEPTTIFGSTLALGVGGWLKRKKSSQQNKSFLSGK